MSRSIITLDDKAQILLVGTDVGDFGKGGEFVQNFGTPLGKGIEVGGLERVLVLGVCLAAADANVLRILQEHVGASLAGGFAAQPGNHLVGSGLAHPDRFELHVYIGGVATEASAAGFRRPCGDGFDVGIFTNLLLEPEGFLNQRLVGNMLVADDETIDAAGILLGEKSLGNLDVEVDVGGQGEGQG